MANNKIVRTAHRAEGGITAGEKARMDEHAQAWIANAVRTDTVDRAALTQAIKDLYRVAGRPEPIVVIVPSPRIMAFAGGFAAAIWYLREKDDATDHATDHATRAATGAATADATDHATRDATDHATADATRAATFDATDDATDHATRDATDAATADATRAATDHATLDATLFTSVAQALLGQHALFGLKCAQLWYRFYQGGNMWAGYDSYLTAARDILGLKLPAHAAYEAWERCAKSGGFRLMHEKFCMVSDFPCVLERDAENRPHCATGPSHRWRDGWSLYHWHGVRVTQQIIEAPHTLTVQQIESEQNAEVRRVMIERYGAKRYAEDSGATLVHECPVNHPLLGLKTAKLWRKEVPDDEPIVMVDLLNSTPEPDGSIKRYQLRVDPNAYDGHAARDCHAAVASTWRNDDGSLTFKRAADYAPVFES